MALFSRRRPEEVAEHVEEAPLAATGPWDAAEAPDGDRVDLGALRIPKVAGKGLRLELDPSTRTPVAATVSLRDSMVQLQVFAAPRTASLWDEIRPEVAQSVAENGGEVDDVPGEFGRELLAKLPVTTPGGSGTRRVRFVGIDGPRWMVRATFSGPAATDLQEAKDLEGVVRDLVIVRGTHAMPPREGLPLTVPGQVAPAPAQPAAGIDDPSVLNRGPEMTETR